MNVHGYDYRTGKGFEASVNVKASTPTKASAWLLNYPHAAGLPSHTSLEVMQSYKLRKQPVWTKESGRDDYRFDIQELEEFRV